MPDGFLLKGRYGSPIHVGPEKFIPLDPVAVFRVTAPGESPTEHILTASTLSGVLSMPGEPDFAWVVYRPTFAGNFCTLAEVPRDLLTDGIGESFPASFRADFSPASKGLDVDGHRLEWLGNGITLQHGSKVKVLVEARQIAFPAASVQLHSIHGRSYFRLRIDKKQNVKVFQD